MTDQKDLVPTLTICRQCHGPNIDGSRICRWCLAYVPPDLGTRQLPGTPARASADCIDLLIYVRGNAAPIRRELRFQLLIGRLDSNYPMHPDIDLTEFVGNDTSVSRTHLMIQRSDKRVIAIDMGSTNGTRINNARMVPSMSYPVHPGDELMLGAMPIRVYW